MTMLASQITSLTVVYSIVYSGVNQRKYQSSASLAFVREIHRGPVNFSHKWPVTRKMFPFDDVIMYAKYIYITNKNCSRLNTPYRRATLLYCQSQVSMRWERYTPYKKFMSTGHKGEGRCKHELKSGVLITKCNAATGEYFAWFCLSRPLTCHIVTIWGTQEEIRPMMFERRRKIS